MFSSSDYKELVSTGVDTGFMTLVESAYRVLFEAGSSNLLRAEPFKFDEAARFLGIDTTNCEGRELVRKVTADPRFTRVDNLINSVMDTVMDKAGLRYKDENGESVWVYPDVKNSVNFRNYEENIKNALKLAVLRHVGPIDAEFDNELKSIDTCKLADNLIYEIFRRHEFGNAIRQNNDRFEERFGGTYITSPDDTGHTVVGSISRSYGDDEIQPLMKNADGTEWFKTRNDEGTVHAMLVGPSGDDFIRLLLNEGDGSRIVELHIPSDLDSQYRFGEDFVNFVTSDFCTGIDNHMVDRSEELYYIVSRFTPDDKVRLVRTALSDMDSNIAKLWYVYDNGDDDVAAYTLGGLFYFRQLAFLVECADKGLVDSDDLSEWAEIQLKHGIHVFDPEIMMLARKWMIMNTRVRASNSSDPGSTTIHLDVLEYDTNELIKALTGNSGHANPSVEDYRKIDAVNDSEINLKARFSPNTLRDSNLQMAILHERGFNALLDLLFSVVVQGYSYPPLSEDVVDYELNKAGANIGTVCERLNRYFHETLLEFSRGNCDASSARSRDTLFSDVRKFMTPRVQQAIANERDADSIAWLIDYGKYVPGFKILTTGLYDDAVLHYDGEYESIHDINLYRDSVTGNMLLRKIREISDDTNTEQLSTFLKLCLGRHIVKEVETNSPIGKRILATFVRICESYSKGNWPCLPLMESKLKKEFIDDMVTYFKTYIKPTKRIFAFNTESIQSFRGRAVESALRDVIKSYFNLYTLDSGLARELFLDKKRGGILSCNVQALIEENGKKKMEIQNDKFGRCIVAYEVSRLIDSGYPNRNEKNAMTDLIKDVLAGQNLLSVVDNYDWDKMGIHKDNVINRLFMVSEYYDNDLTDDAAPVISASEIETIVADNPSALLPIIQYLPSHTAEQVCRNYFTPEIVKKLSSTQEGIELLLRLSAIGDWHNFTEQFVRANEMRINSVLNNIPPSEADRIRKMIEPYMNKTKEFSSSGGSIASAELGKTVDYHEANGLKWMTGYYDGDGGIESPVKKKIKLYNIDQATAIMNKLGTNGWHIPTVDELTQLGEDSSLITSRQLGFSPTGAVDEEGNLVQESDVRCNAWCVDRNGELQPYVVINNTITIDTNDEYIVRDTDSVAIKLVR